MREVNASWYARRMSRKDTDKAVEKYVYDLMPKKVQKALAVAVNDVYYGPSGAGGGFIKNAKIVADWWRDNMGDDLVVDDGDNVSTKREYDNFLRVIGKERYAEALQEYADEHPVGEDEEFDDDAAEAWASNEAQNYVDGSQEGTMLYSDRDVQRLLASEAAGDIFR
jgi:hypothetical protein